MKAKELRQLPLKKLEEILMDKRKELLKLKGKVRNGLVPDNPSQIRNIRRDIARILTVRVERK